MALGTKKEMNHREIIVESIENIFISKAFLVHEGQDAHELDMFIQEKINESNKNFEAMDDKDFVVYLLNSLLRKATGLKHEDIERR